MNRKFINFIKKSLLIITLGTSLQTLSAITTITEADLIITPFILEATGAGPRGDKAEFDLLKGTQGLTILLKKIHTNELREAAAALNDKDAETADEAVKAADKVFNRVSHTIRFILKPDEFTVTGLTTLRSPKTLTDKSIEQTPFETLKASIKNKKQFTDKKFKKLFDDLNAALIIARKAIDEKAITVEQEKAKVKVDPTHALLEELEAAIKPTR